MIEAYGSEVGQIILNLLKNAIDSIPQKGEIRIITNETEKDVNIIVSDTGTGISAEVLPYIFDPFYAEA